LPVDRIPCQENNADSYVTWEGSANGSFMPTQHLLSLFVNGDGTLDPTFYKIFQNDWSANKEFVWTKDFANKYDKDTTAILGQTIAVGEDALSLLCLKMPIILQRRRLNTPANTLLLIMPMYTTMQVKVY
jgi:hypothetical protein